MRTITPEVIDARDSEDQTGHIFEALQVLREWLDSFTIQVRDS